MVCAGFKEFSGIAINTWGWKVTPNDNGESGVTSGVGEFGKKTQNKIFRWHFFFSASLILNFDKTNDILFQKQKSMMSHLSGKENTDLA